jgi:hypothetical protein
MELIAANAYGFCLPAGVSQVKLPFVLPITGFVTRFVPDPSANYSRKELL